MTTNGVGHHLHCTVNHGRLEAVLFALAFLCFIFWIRVPGVRLKKGSVDRDPGIRTKPKAPEIVQTQYTEKDENGILEIGVSLCANANVKM